MENSYTIQDVKDDKKKMEDDIMRQILAFEQKYYGVSIEDVKLSRIDINCGAGLLAQIDLDIKIK